MVREDGGGAVKEKVRKEVRTVKQRGEDSEVRR